MTTKEHLRVAGILTKVLDEQFNLLGVKIGVDPLLALVPGIGSLFGAVPSFYMVWIAWTIRIPEEQIARMIRNVVIDFLIGGVPVIGALGDIFYRANRKNLEILKTYAKDFVEGEILPLV